MKVKTDFKQMVLVDHILHNKLNSITKPDVHIQQVRTPMINPFPTNSIHPPNPPPTYSASTTATTTAPTIAPSIPPKVAPTTAPSIVPISEPPPNNDNSVPNNEWEKQAHQWIDTFQQPNYVNYMDTSAQMEDNTNAAQSEAVEYTNTPQRAVIPKTMYTQRIHFELYLNYPPSVQMYSYNSHSLTVEKYQTIGVPVSPTHCLEQNYHY